MKKIKFGIVGAGGIAQTYAQVFEQSEIAQLVAVADTRIKAATALAEIYCDGRAYQNYQDLLDNEKEIEAVVIATPPATHTELANYFLKHKKHVLCEKPLCLSTGEAREMIKIAENAGVVFTMASKFRYVEDVIKAKSIVASGILGEILLFENAFTAQVDMTQRWNSQPELSGGGVLIDNGTHSVDIVRYFFGPIADVLVIEGNRKQGMGVEENVQMHLRTVSGTLASVDLSWSINKDLPNFISIYGTNGSLHVGWRESKYRLHSSPDWTIFGSGYDKVQAFHGKINNFARCLSGAEELLINPVDALASVQVIEAAYTSLGQNLWTAVSQSNS